MLVDRLRATFRREDLVKAIRSGMTIESRGIVTNAAESVVVTRLPRIRLIFFQFEAVEWPQPHSHKNIFMLHRAPHVRLAHWGHSPTSSAPVSKLAVWSVPFTVDTSLRGRPSSEFKFAAMGLYPVIFAANSQNCSDRVFTTDPQKQDRALPIVYHAVSDSAGSHLYGIWAPVRFIVRQDPQWMRW